MSRNATSLGRTLLMHLHGAMLAATALAAAAAIGFTFAGLLGLVPMLHLPLAFGDTVYTGAGTLVQIGVATVMLALIAAIPSAFRVLKLERSHRDFSICMSDVAEAYRICHAADRQGAFTMASEFDAVKERIQFMHRHPELGNLEPDVIEAAALMSQASHRLAEIYSDEALGRARRFLDQRQQEVESFQRQIARVTSACKQMRVRLDLVESEEGRMGARLTAIDAEFGEMLRDLGYVKEEASLFDWPPVAAE